MKNSIIFFFLFLVNLATAQEEYGRKVVKEIASSSYYGRGYVFDGDLKAAKYIASEFKKNGIVPLASNDNNYFQYFTLSPNTFPQEAKLTLDGVKLKVGRDFLIDAASKSLKGDFQWLSLDFSLVQNKSIQSILNNANYKNKFLFIEEKEALVQLGSEKYKNWIDSLKHGGLHAGVIINSSNKLVWRTLTYQIEKPVIYLKDYSLQNITSGNLRIVIAAEHKIDYQTQNVCGFLKGTGGSDSTIVITAHYDHIGAIGRKVVFNGANDNASGTALMLYLSQYFKQHPIKYNLVFLAFSAEESGLLGSKYFVNNSLIDLSQIKFLLNLDMAGTGDDGIQVVNGSVFKKDFGRLVEINKKDKLLPDVKIRGAMNRSDHFPFYEKGVPCFFIYTLGGVSFYHDVFDVYETLPFTNFNNYSKLLTKFIEGIN
jgi:hypothetical protein